MDKILLNQFKRLYPSYVEFKAKVIDRVLDFHDGANPPPYLDENKMVYKFKTLYKMLYNKYSNFTANNDDEKQHDLMVNAMQELLPSLYVKTMKISAGALNKLSIDELLSTVERRYNEEADKKYATTETTYSSTPNNSEGSGSFAMANPKEKNITNRKDLTVRVREMRNLLDRYSVLGDIDASGLVYAFVNDFTISSLWRLADGHATVVVASGTNGKDGANGKDGTNGKDGKNGPAWLTDEYADLNDFENNAPDNSKVKYNINADGSNNAKGYVELVKVGGNVLQIVSKEELDDSFDAIEKLLDKKIQFAGTGGALPNGVKRAYDVVKANDGHVYPVTPILTDDEWTKNVNDTMDAKDQSDKNSKDIIDLAVQVQGIENIWTGAQGFGGTNPASPEIDLKTITGDKGAFTFEPTDKLIVKVKIDGTTYSEEKLMRVGQHSDFHIVGKAVGSGGATTDVTFTLSLISSGILRMTNFHSSGTANVNAYFMRLTLVEQNPKATAVIDAYTKSETDTKFSKVDLSNVKVPVANAGKLLKVKNDGSLEYASITVPVMKEKFIEMQMDATLSKTIDTGIPITTPINVLESKIYLPNRTDTTLRESLNKPRDNIYSIIISAFNGTQTGMLEVLKGTTNWEILYTNQDINNADWFFYVYIRIGYIEMVAPSTTKLSHHI